MPTTGRPSPTEPPLRATKRSLSPDLARGVMLLLIALAYTSIYLAHTADGVAPDPGSSFVDQVTNLLRIVLVHERSYTMFAALFGYGMVMIAGSVQRAGGDQMTARKALRRRGWVLVAFGVIHGVAVFSGEILGPYGVAALLLAGVVVGDDRRLVRTIIIWSAVQGVLLAVVWTALGWAGLMGDMAEAVVLEDTWLAAVLANAVTYPVTPVYVLIMYPLVPALLAGVWAGRRRLLQDAAAHRALLRRVAAVGLVISLLGGLPLGLVGAQWWTPEGGALGVALALHNLTGVAGGLGYLAVFGLLGARWEGRPGPVSTLLRSTGERSLTAYLAMSVLVAVTMAPWGLDLGARVSVFAAAAVAFACWIVPALVCRGLAAKGRAGPADALLRRMARRQG